MTPQERDLVTELFDRLATLERSPREADAERTIRDGLKRAPNAVYALVQTVLVQDEALKQADAHIQELQAQLTPSNDQQRSGGGFLDSMRGAFGRKDEPSSRSSVPQVAPRQGGTPPGGPSPWGAGGQGSPGQGVQGGYGSAPPGGYSTAPGPAPTGSGSGSSFLGTMAAGAAGMIGGSLLLSGISSMLGGGGHRTQSFGSTDMSPTGNQTTGSPWSNSTGSETHGGMGTGTGSGSSTGTGTGNLSRDAGLDDIGRGGQQGSSDSNRSAGLFDSNTSGDINSDSGFGDSVFGGGDDGGGGGDGGD